MEIGNPVRTVALAAAGALCTVAVLGLVEPLRFAFENTDLLIALRTGDALVGLIAAFLFWGRYLRRRRLDDLALSVGFALLGLNNLCFGVVPAIAADSPSTFSIWATTAGSLIATAVIAIAALLPPRRLRLERGQLGVAIVAPLVLIGLVGAALALAEGDLPAGVAIVEGTATPELEAHALIYAAQAMLLVLFAGAAARFATRAAREHDQLFAWLAVGSVLAGAARLDYLFYPSLHVAVFSTGDVFRLSFYIVVLGAALQEISSYWRSVADLAALEERRRVARDIHDVLAQDLASISRNLAWLEDEDNTFVQRARSAAERALLETRRALAALTDRGDSALGPLLGDIVRQVGEREGVQIALKMDRDLHVDVAQREALAMIAAEAVTNAARHGEAAVVHVEVRGGRGVTLTVRDSGRGFDPGEATDGYGLTIMRERAEAVGGRLRVRSQPEGGTDVEVVL